MRERLAIACTLALIALLGFFEFPGHTYLQSDTQIYVPMMERLWDPTTLSSDLVASKPHLAFTIYDEVSMALRWLTRGSFEPVLIWQQVLFRMCQVAGIYLIAAALPLSRWAAVFVTALGGLGATIAGPAVLVMEYEPVPRGFAIGLVFLAIGLAMHEWLIAASCAASLAFLYHAPTTLPFWICFVPVLLWRRCWRGFLPLLAAAVAIGIAARLQAGGGEPQQFFFRLDPELERLQKLRAGYNWVSNWGLELGWQYLAMWALSLLAYWRVAPRRGRVFLIGLPLIGMLSVPVSYVLLDRWKWGLMSQVQPARALLFVTAILMILGAAAGVRAAERRLWIEGVAWFGLVLTVAMRQWNLWLDARACGVALSLGLALVFAARWRWCAPALALTAYFLIPHLAAVRHYPTVETADLRDVERFAKEHSSKNAVFLFSDVGHGLQPGVFRARALRPVYVDWKAGGQVNYYRSLADEWWSRWERSDELRGGEDARRLGVEYVVRTRVDAAKDGALFRNRSYSVFRVR